MNNLELIQSFAKGVQKEKKISGKSAIIYTRVSSKEQTENLSLDVQLKGCENFASKNALTIKGIFGGTYESAQSDERKEFQRMVFFAKNSKENISYIIVYSLERFSRTGENAIWLSRQLRELGIAIISVSQPIDTTNPSGVLQQNILFLFSQYDNDLRRQKCIDGMHEKLLRGEWVGMVPIGYSYDRTGGSKEQKIIINKDGNLVRKAFEMKAHEKLSNTLIVKKINALGLKLSMQRLCEMLRNPFYTGFLSHNLLRGQIAKGKHSAIISEELFLEANEMLKKNPQGYKQKKFEDNIPLKQFVICADCGTPFTGYVVKKKDLWYYKCNKIGCKCNKSAQLLHNKFEEVLNYFTLDQILIDPVSEYLESLFEIQSQESVGQSKELRAKITELKEKLFKVEERYALGDIDREIYDRISSKLNLEKGTLSSSLSDLELNLSNPSKMIRNSVEKAANLTNWWVSGDAVTKHNFQELLFPGGIHYDRKIDHYRTIKVNPLIKVIESFSKTMDKKRGDRPKFFIDLSPSVVRTGIEPVLPE
jgi:site-specific DNA recombinase